MTLGASRKVRMLAAIALAASLLGQEPPPDWFKKNDKKNRYEGLVDHPQARRAYELLGFFADWRELPLSENTKLRIRFFRPAKDPVKIVAREIRVEKQYLMLPKEESIALSDNGWSEFENWEATDLVKSFKIPSRNIGVVIHLNDLSEAGQDIAPAFLDTQPGGPQAHIGEYTLFLTVDGRLNNLQCQVVDQGSTKVYPCSAGGGNRSIEARTVIPVTIQAGRLPKGDYQIRIDAKYANELTKQLAARFRFHHEPL
jgi:hypothetical protein